MLADVQRLVTDMPTPVSLAASSTFPNPADVVTAVGARMATGQPLPLNKQRQAESTANTGFAP